jgi:DNA-binding CsgD family transcriptional regulator
MEHDLRASIEPLTLGLEQARLDDDIGIQVFALTNLAFVHLALARAREAAGYANEAILLARSIRDLNYEGVSLSNLAIATAEVGDPAEADAAIRRACTIASSMGTPIQVMDVLRSAGAVAAINGRPLEAAWLNGAAKAAFLPSVLADPQDNATSGAARHWRTARRATDSVSWELAERDGLAANRAEALDRAANVVQLRDRPKARIRLRLGEITPREVEILTLVGQGRSDVEIGHQLFISPKTASVHVANVKAKLGLGSRVDVAIRARDLGLLGLAERGTELSQV